MGEKYREETDRSIEAIRFPPDTPTNIQEMVKDQKRVARALGCHSTLAGVEFLDLDKVRVNWSGDSSVLHITPDGKITAYPEPTGSNRLTSSVAVKVETNGVVITNPNIRAEDIAVQPKSQLILCTDALADCIVKTRETEPNLVKSLVAAKTNEDFAAIIKDLRDRNLLKNDDVAFQGIRIPGDDSVAHANQGRGIIPNANNTNIVPPVTENPPLTTTGATASTGGTSTSSVSTATPINVGGTNPSTTLINVGGTNPPTTLINVGGTNPPTTPISENTVPLVNTPANNVTAPTATPTTRAAHLVDGVLSRPPSRGVLSTFREIPDGTGIVFGHPKTLANAKRSGLTEEQYNQLAFYPSESLKGLSTSKLQQLADIQVELSASEELLKEHIQKMGGRVKIDKLDEKEGELATFLTYLNPQHSTGRDTKDFFNRLEINAADLDQPRRKMLEKVKTIADIPLVLDAGFRDYLQTRIKERVAELRSGVKEAEEVLRPAVERAYLDPRKVDGSIPSQSWSQRESLFLGRSMKYYRQTARQSIPPYSLHLIQ